MHRSILGVQTSVLRSGGQFFVFARFQAIALYSLHAILRKHEQCFFFLDFERDFAFFH